jgi:hypothetical protein
MIKNNSRWLNDNFHNIVASEIEDVEYPIPLPGSKPMKVFEWICNNNAKELLFNSLSEFAPLFPMVSYHGEASAYLSPPPSGSGNAVFIIIGKDKSGKLRAAGGNYFNSGTQGNYFSKDFWNDYDTRKDDQSKFGLISGTIGFHKKYYPANDIYETERISEYVRTMPIYLLALDGQIGHMAVFPAIAWGKYPSDFSYEKLGEVSV